MEIRRTIQPQIEKSLFQGKIIIIYGARQVGKTTLIREIQKKYPDATYFNGDEPDVRAALTDKTSAEIKAFFGEKRLVFIDEAQRIKNIGLTLKLVVDNYPEIQVVATGSSSFELSNEIAEPLTGRKNEFWLYPFSLEELSSVFSDLETKRLLEERMIFGMYPDVVLGAGDKTKTLKSLAFSYSYKDALQYQNIKNPDLLESLLQALALQIGNEVSFGELASLVGSDKNTVSSYVQILEKAFIIFRLRPFSRNLRNELKRLRKIYFFDTGLRNALINNLNPLNLRQDTGALWENFVISERMKLNKNNQKEANSFFWRTHQRQEIDYLEEAGGKLDAFEIKFRKNKYRPPKAFSRAYPDTEVQLVNRENALDSFLTNLSKNDII